jgi:hypothetical protein
MPSAYEANVALSICHCNLAELLREIKKAESIYSDKMYKLSLEGEAAKARAATQPAGSGNAAYFTAVAEAKYAERDALMAARYLQEQVEAKRRKMARIDVEAHRRIAEECRRIETAAFESAVQRRMAQLLSTKNKNSQTKRV